MEKEDSISRAEIHQIAWRVRDDEADPEEVQELLEYICTLVDREEQLPPEMLKYIRDSLRTYLNHSRKSLDRSFGVKRKNVRPKAPRSQRVAMATEVLRLRLKGRNYEYAVSAVGVQFDKKPTVVGEAWAAHKFDSHIALRCERPKGKHPWTKREEARLYKIFANESWLITPGKKNS